MVRNMFLTGKSKVYHKENDVDPTGWRWIIEVKGDFGLKKLSFKLRFSGKSFQIALQWQDVRFPLKKQKSERQSYPSFLFVCFFDFVFFGDLLL